MSKYGYNSEGKLFIYLILLVVILLGIAPLLVMFAWWAIVPDVFAGCVEQGFVPDTVTWWQAFKIAMLGGLIGAGASGISK